MTARSFGFNARNLTRSSDPDADLGAYLQALADEITNLQESVVRGTPPGYRIEIRDRGPAVVDVFNNRVAYLEWEDDR